MTLIISNVKEECVEAFQSLINGIHVSNANTSGTNEGISRNTSSPNESTQAQMPKNKGGAPLKAEEHKATSRVNFYCTKAEKYLLQEMAQDYNMKIGEFVRFKLFKEQKIMKQ